MRVVLPISFFERANQAYFNSVAVLDTDGTNLGVYRKSHIPDGPGYQEKLEEEAAMVSQQRWGTRKQVVVFFGNAGIAIRDGWGANALLQASRKVVERPNSGRPTDRVKVKAVTVDEYRTSRVSSAMNSPQPCEEELDRSKPTRPVRCKTACVRSAWPGKVQPACCGQPGASSLRRQCGASCGAPSWTRPPLRLQRSPQPPAGRGEQVAPTGAVQVATPSSGSCQGQGVPVVASNRIGREVRATSDITFYGGSFIAGQTGNIVAQVGATEIINGTMHPCPDSIEGFVVAHFDLDACASQRAAWGLFRDRRPDLYRPLLTLDGANKPA
ncbi:CN hydrolase domain-containing protein, partial [Haematococcus lacustris]